MADASAGQPLARRHGVLLYSAQTDYGTPVTPATAVGAWTFSGTRHSSNYDVRGPGSPNFLARKGGSTYHDFQLNTSHLQTGAKTLLLKAQRTAGVLPLVTMAAGYSDDVGTPNRSADQIQDVKLGGFSLSGDTSSGHQPISCTLRGVGGLITEVTTLAPATLSTTPWDTSEGVITRGGSAYPIRSFGVDKDHSVSRDHVIPGAAPSTFHRGHTYLTEHDETVTGSISRYQRSGVNVQASTIPQAAMVWTFTNRVDSVVLTCTYVDVDFDEEVQDEDENGIFWSFKFTAKTLVLS